MSISKDELEAMIERIVSKHMQSTSVEHSHKAIDKHYAECPDCGARNPNFNPDGACENCDMPVYKSDLECPWCHDSTRIRPLTREDTRRFYSHRLRG